MMRKIIVALVLVQGAVLAEQSPFNLTYIFPEDMHGWCGISNKACLKEFIAKKNPKRVVEVGTWLGVSAIFTAKLLNNDAKLFCVDPWMPYHDMEKMSVSEMKDAYERFLSNCIHNKVTDKIVPLRMTSLQASRLEQFSQADIDLIYIDGSHTEEDAFDDIIAWYSKLSSEGVMCGNDLGWTSVQAALKRAAPILNVTIQRNDTFWWLEKKTDFDLEERVVNKRKPTLR